VSTSQWPATSDETVAVDRGRTFRLGIVKTQDAANARVRVVFAEFDQMLSYWLPVVVPKTQNDKAYWLPDIGEQVVCLMDERDEAGVVLGAIYSKVDSTPVQSADKYHLGFKDGTSMEYDRAAHVLALSFMDGTAIKYDAGTHALALDFEDAASIKYDASAHTMTLSFNDGTSIKYDATAHAFTMTGGVASASIVAPAGIVLTAGGSSVSILSSGVSIIPPLPLSSTVAS
jgi:phage baseplate assembly protein gpV